MQVVVAEVGQLLGEEDLAGPAQGEGEGDQSLLRSVGLTLQTPKAVGSGVPAGLSSTVSAGG